jgi:uncharacterized surface protein with fasciclin (FAS1) repeats
MNNNKTMGIVAAVIGLAVIGGGVFWAMNREDSIDETATTENQTVEQQTSSDIVGLATGTPTLSTLVTALKAASLVETLQGAGPFTVFAPTDDAFAALPAGTLDSLLLPENVETLKSILTYHVVSGKVMSTDLSDGQVEKTVQGNNLTVKISDGVASLVDAKGTEVSIVTADVDATNGVVHVISGVLLPN